MKYWVGVHRNTGDANKDMFDYRSYCVEALSKEEATEKGRALALADDPEHTNLEIYARMDNEEEFVWRNEAYELLKEAIGMIRCKENFDVIGKINEAIRAAHLDKVENEYITTMCIDNFRRIAGKTQREVSNAVGITLNNYARLERGEADVRKMSLENAMKLCDALCVTPFELMVAGDNTRKKHQKE